MALVRGWCWPLQQHSVLMAERTAQLYLDNVYSQFGLADSILTDRGLQFMHRETQYRRSCKVDAFTVECCPVNSLARECVKRLGRASRPILKLSLDTLTCYSERALDSWLYSSTRFYLYWGSRYKTWKPTSLSCIRPPDALRCTKFLSVHTDALIAYRRCFGLPVAPSSWFTTPISEVKILTTVPPGSSFQSTLSVVSVPLSLPSVPFLQTLIEIGSLYEGINFYTSLTRTRFLRRILLRPSAAILESVDKSCVLVDDFYSHSPYRQVGVRFPVTSMAGFHSFWQEKTQGLLLLCCAGIPASLIALLWAPHCTLIFPNFSGCRRVAASQTPLYHIWFRCTGRGGHSVDMIMVCFESMLRARKWQISRCVDFTWSDLCSYPIVCSKVHRTTCLPRQRRRYSAIFVQHLRKVEGNFPINFYFNNI